MRCFNWSWVSALAARTLATISCDSLLKLLQLCGKIHQYSSTTPMPTRCRTLETIQALLEAPASVAVPLKAQTDVFPVCPCL